MGAGGHGNREVFTPVSNTRRTLFACQVHPPGGGGAPIACTAEANWVEIEHYPALGENEHESYDPEASPTPSA